MKITRKRIQNYRVPIATPSNFNKFPLFYAFLNSIDDSMDRFEFEINTRKYWLFIKKYTKKIIEAYIKINFNITRNYKVNFYLFLEEKKFDRRSVP